MMLQENSFFFSPQTYFGNYQNLEDDAEFDEEEWHLTAPWQISLDSNMSILLQQRIGLFIHWQDANE